MTTYLSIKGYLSRTFLSFLFSVPGGVAAPGAAGQERHGDGGRGGAEERRPARPRQTRGRAVPQPARGRRHQELGRVHLVSRGNGLHIASCIEKSIDMLRFRNK